ncbi:MAG TPA: S8 family serine peptidase [Pyrinomonadaceae bacterium]|nr:S8 family serine peptidase [Pyrinomonadaceae bacterium]
MSIAYIIHSDADREFVQNTLLRPLPSRGFQRWISSTSLRDDADFFPSQVMRACDVILAVVSPSAAESDSVREEMNEGRFNSTPMILVQAKEITESERRRIPKEVWSLPLVNLCQPTAAAWRELTALLPVAGDHESPLLSNVAKPIEWNEELFSEALKGAVSLHDHNRAETLVTTFTRYIEQRPYSYAPGHAIRDIGVLRKNREFKLMSRYAEAVLFSGTRDEEVRRQYAQSLIEQKQFDRALEILNSIVEDPASRPKEVAEAYGLMGRTFKQQYQDDPERPGSHELLLKSMDAYRIVYEKDPRHIWHGVNLASCIVRAHRDGVAGVRLKEAEEIAARLLEEIDRLERSGDIGVWDYATRVEALLVLKRYDEAAAALDQYLHHPEMHAFEVSSTYRQFNELLQLGRDPLGKPILDRLWETVQRYRGVSFSSLPPVIVGSEGLATTTATRPLLIRISDPEWTPGHVSDLTIGSQLGTIVSAQGSDATVKDLLSDPNVISVNDSTPGGTPDCDVSVPFIGVADDYVGPDGRSYKEKGSRALVAIIDNGIDVLHQAFLDADGKSRIVGIWDQTDSSGNPPNGFQFGTYHDQIAIAGYLNNKPIPPKLGRNLNGNGHGTHVASIAAGRKIDVAGAFAGGVAPEAKILVVIADGNGPIGYNNSHVDALKFIDNVATEMKLPVVVNVSQGMNAGAHDGRSLLEIGFDGFSKGGREPGRVVVKSAGNEGDKRGHAEVPLSQSAIKILPWTRDPQARVAERIELWWKSDVEVAFRLCNPSGEWTRSVSNTNPKEANSFADGTKYDMEFTPRHVDNGDSQLRIKIGDEVSKVTPGPWQLEILTGKVPPDRQLHAWIERGLGTPTIFTNFENQKMTLSVPGTAYSVITVGAVKAASPTQLGSFSSFGPTRDNRQKPEVTAPGVGVRAAQAGTATGIIPKCGSSMAAPHVTGAIALLLSRMAESGQPMPTASQISTALLQKTKHYNSSWDPGEGFGILDVSAFLAAF